MKNVAKPTLSSKAYRKLRLLLPDLTDDATHANIYMKWYMDESDDKATKKIPLDYNSKYFLCWLGFTEEAAQVMYDEWLENIEDDKSPQLTEKCYRIISDREVPYCQVPFTKSGWDGAMRELGISPDLVKELRKEEEDFRVQPMNEAHPTISEWLGLRVFNSKYELKQIEKALENFREDLLEDKCEPTQRVS